MPDRQTQLDETNYQIALRHDDLGLDDIVVKDVAMFRMERMTESHVWFACQLTDGQWIDFDLHAGKGAVKYAVREFDMPKVVYEKGGQGAD